MPDPAIPDYLANRATTLEEAYSRFDPQTPLPVGSPFYVKREDNPLGRLTRKLLLSGPKNPKLFWAGHRGCGKSTELNQLVARADIQERFWPVKFSVRETSDFNDLTHIEVLLAIGGEIYRQYTEAGQRLKDDLLQELNRWKETTVIRLNQKGAVFESGAGFDIGAFLLSALLKVKTEHSTRQIVRQEIGPNLTRLIEIINLICAEILGQTGRPVLVVVEDMDKPSLAVSRKLFEESLVNLTQPACSIVYTVPVAIYFDPTYTQIQDTSFFLPNIKLHPKGQPDTARPGGVKIMRHLVLARMNEVLISSDALTAAIQASGGVFREMTLLMQRSIDNALSRDSGQVELVDVQRTMAQRRSEFRRLLSDDDYRLLLAVRTGNEMRHPDKLAALLHLLAVLEYNGEDNWCDVHPVLHPLLDEVAATLDEDEAGKMIE